jgi:steroid delta-isomerase-like uncharacterized protein
MKGETRVPNSRRTGADTPQSYKEAHRYGEARRRATPACPAEPRGRRVANRQEVAMDESNSRALIRRYVEAVWQTGHPERIGEFATHDFTFHCPVGTLQGETFQQYVKGLGAGFPDAEFHIDAVFSDGNMGAFLWVLTGTQTGEFMGIPPTGRKVTIPGTSVLRFEAHQIAEAWSRWDRMTLLEQLGIKP